MKSKWSHLRETAIQLRYSGNSLRDIEKSLNIPRSTLGGWFRKIILTEEQKNRLKTRWLMGLAKAREKAIIWHRQQRETRIMQAKHQALETLSKLDSNNMSIEELALAMLYLGEGAKGDKHGTCIGSSDPLILKFFITYLINQKISINKIKCSLHLRADQNPEKLKKYWSKELNIPSKNFTLPSIDIRTAGRATYSNYHGVCVVNCGNIAIQRKLIFLSRKFCEKVVNKN